MDETNETNQISVEDSFIEPEYSHFRMRHQANRQPSRMSSKDSKSSKDDSDHDDDDSFASNDDHEDDKSSSSDSSSYNDHSSDESNDSSTQVPPNTFNIFPQSYLTASPDALRSATKAQNEITTAFQRLKRTKRKKSIKRRIEDQNLFSRYC